MNPDDLIESADNYLKSGDFEKAINFYDKALSIDNTNSSVWKNKGIAYIGLTVGTIRIKDILNKYKKAK